MTKAQRIASSLYEQINAAWAQDDPLRTRWEQKRNEYIGSERRGPMGGVQAEDQSNSLDIPLGFLHINTLIPTIFAKDPVIDAYPATDADAPNAPIWEGLINQTLPLIRFKQIIKACHKDCMIYGEGWKKYGWSGRSKAKDPSPPVPGENGTAPPQDFVSQALSAQGYLVQPGPVPRPKPSRTLPSTGEASSAPLTWLLKDGPWVSRLAPQDVVVDPWSPDRDPTMARFIAIKFIKPLAEVRATPGYKIPANFKPKRGQSGGTEFMWSAGMVTADDSGKGRRDGGGELPGNPVVFWEVWVYDLYLENEENPEGDPIRVYRRVLTLLDGADEPIRDVGWEELLGTDYVGYPIHRIAANEVPDEPPMGELEATGPLQDAINTLARKALANINRFARMGLVDSKALVDGETALERLKKGEDGTYEKTKGSPKDVFAPLPSPGNSPETYTMLNTLMEVYQLVSGISANRKGEADARTATEARIIEGATSIKVQEKDDSVRDFCEAGIMTLIALFKSFVDRQ